MKKYLSMSRGDEVLMSRVEDASTFFTRMMGLMYRKSMSDECALLITPCNQIHMFGMKFEIDAVYLSKDDEIVKIERNIKVRTICKTVKNAYKTLEVTCGTADRLALAVGDILTFKANAE